MRLPPFPGRVKFRPVRLPAPPPTLRRGRPGAPGRPGGGSVPIRGHREPPGATPRRPGARSPDCTAAGSTRCHSSSNRSSVSPVVASTAALEIVARATSRPMSGSRCRADSAGPARSRRRRQVRRRRRPWRWRRAGRPSSRVRLGQGAAGHGKLSSSTPKPLPLAGRPAGVAFVEPERDPPRHRLVQGEWASSCRSVRERSLRRRPGARSVRLVGSAIAAAPARRSAAGERVQSACVGHDDQRKRSRRGRPRPGHSLGRSAVAASWMASVELRGPRDRGDLPDLHRCGRARAASDRIAPRPSSRIRKPDCAGPHLRRPPGPAFPGTAWPRD